jgi:hypothetical protein
VRTDVRQRDLCSPPKNKEAKQTNDSFSYFAQGEMKYKTSTNQWHTSLPHPPLPPDNAWKSFNFHKFNFSFFAKNYRYIAD